MDLIKKGIYFNTSDWETLQSIGKSECTSASYLARKAIKEFIKRYKTEI